MKAQYKIGQLVEFEIEDQQLVFGSVERVSFGRDNAITYRVVVGGQSGKEYEIVESAVRQCYLPKRQKAATPRKPRAKKAEQPQVEAKMNGKGKGNQETARAPF